MKMLHRIRVCLIVLLLFMLHCCSVTASNAPDGVFKDCGVDPTSLMCFVHRQSCYTFTNSKDRYIKSDHDEIKNDCKRYLIMTAKTLDKVEIEFRDDTIPKATGAKFTKIGGGPVFECIDNKVSSAIAQWSLTSTDTSAIKTLYCKFELTDTTASKNILLILKDQFPTKVNGLIIEGTDWTNFHFECDWIKRIFDQNQVIPKETEDDEGVKLVQFNKITRKCPEDESTAANKYFLKYKPLHTDPKRNVWETINSFLCDKGVIKVAKASGADEDANLRDGSSKCVRKKCAGCPSCTNCDPPADPLPDATTASPDECPPKATFTPSDGESCAKITCSNTCKAMRVESEAGRLELPQSTLDCSVEKKWKDFDKDVTVTCLKVLKCTESAPIVSKCPDADDVPKGKKCIEPELDNSGKELCAPDETWYMPPQAGKTEPDTGAKRRLIGFKCDVSSGIWAGNWTTEKDAKEVPMDEVRKHSTFYCLAPEDKPPAAPSQGGLPAGQLIGIIIGVGVVVAIIVALVVFCLKRHLKKKGNRDEMKSVSVTGRGDKKNSRKSKGSKSTGSKTSEISAPPPPPCPDSLSFNVEPDPPPRSNAPPSSGGGGAPAAVGPDTGKPDKPAELIDINSTKSNVVSEKKADSSKKDGPPQDATVANTVTGTDSRVEPAGKTVTDTTKKADKNGESARSDTGRISKVEGAKKKRGTKVTLDKNGRGLTDDDDYNIDSGAKPVNHDDKNKKPYTPKVDPRKKMINVTMTEDEDGHVKPKVKSGMF